MGDLNAFFGDRDETCARIGKRVTRSYYGSSFFCRAVAYQLDETDPMADIAGSVTGTQQVREE